MQPQLFRLRADILWLQEVHGQEPSTSKLLPGADQSGYKVIGNKTALSARDLIKTTMPDGLCQHYYISRPTRN
jgi:hypothetical protein